MRPYTPTPVEIAAATAEIRATWSPAEELARRTHWAVDRLDGSRRFYAAIADAESRAWEPPSYAEAVFA